MSEWAGCVCAPNSGTHLTYDFLSRPRRLDLFLFSYVCCGWDAFGQTRKNAVPCTSLFFYIAPFLESSLRVCTVVSLRVSPVPISHHFFPCASSNCLRLFDEPLTHIVAEFGCCLERHAARYRRGIPVCAYRRSTTNRNHFSMRIHVAHTFSSVRIYFVEDFFC